jgi:hypothetical protein
VNTVATEIEFLLFPQWNVYKILVNLQIEFQQASNKEKICANILCSVQQQKIYIFEYPKGNINKQKMLDNFFDFFIAFISVIWHFLQFLIWAWNALKMFNAWLSIDSVNSWH